LGSDGTFRGCGLGEGPEVTGDMLLKGIMGTQALLFFLGFFFFL
jgi:hypothetical protein